MKILRLTAENVKRLSVVEIAPDGSPVVVVAGENEAGKSSVLDSIAYALGGKDLLPAQPVRDGKDKATVTLDLGDYIVKRTFTAGGGGSLAVMNREGAKFPSPQALLDGLVGKLSFDPMAFASMKPADQAATLRALAHIDTTDQDLARKTAFDQRTEINRDLTKAQGALAKLPAKHEDVGTEPEAFDELTRQLERADALADQASVCTRAADRAEATVKAALARVSAVKARMADLQRQIDAAEQELDTASMAATVAEDAQASTAAEKARALAKVPDRATLRSQIGTITARNAKVAENRARAALEQEVADTKAKADALTTRIANLDTAKAEALAQASFPVSGLGLNDQGVTWNGLPFDQAATSVRIRASVAIGLALNPKLKVLLIRNGNDLGRTNLAAVAEMAREAGAQVWVERIAGGDGQTTVLIEDGTVAGKAVTK